VNGSSRSLQHGRAAWLTQTMQARDERKHDIGAVGQVASEVIVSFAERIGEYAKSHTQSLPSSTTSSRPTQVNKSLRDLPQSAHLLLPSTASSISFCDAFFFLARLSILYMPPAAFTHRVALVVTQATQTTKISALCARNPKEHAQRVQACKHRCRRADGCTSLGLSLGCHCML